MDKRLESFLGFITGSVVSIVSMAFYRHQTVFAEICSQASNKKLPGSSTGIGTCLNFDQVLMITAISPIYFLASSLIGICVSIILWKG